MFAACHTYKGVALTPLYEISCVLTEATRNSDDVNLDKEEELKKQYNLIRDSYNKNIAG